MLRSLPRAPQSSTCLLPRTVRSNPRFLIPAPPCHHNLQSQQSRAVHAHAISNPTLAGIEKRWENMPPQEQADLWMALRDRMKVDWHDLTLQERKAGTPLSRYVHPAPSTTSLTSELEAAVSLLLRVCVRPLDVIGRAKLISICFSAYWIAFGPHGPRARPPPGENWTVFKYTMYGVGISFVLFLLIRSQARPPPGTMNKEYQEMTNEYLKVRPSIYSCIISTEQDI